MEIVAFANPELGLLSNVVRFLVMFAGGVLLGILYRWERRERRRSYMGVGAGITLLTIQSIIDQYLRLGHPVTWRLPVDIAAFALLIFSLVAIYRTLPDKEADRRYH